MTDNKFQSKQELNDYIKNNSTSFEEFEKRLDYSKFDKYIDKNKKRKGFSWKKLGYALASLVLVVCVTLGIHFVAGIGKVEKCPYELGTYTYYSQEGELEGLDFTEESYIILTDQELSGPGTFTLENKDWVVYGQFYECEFENENIIELNNEGAYQIKEYKVEVWIMKNVDSNKILIEINDNIHKFSVIYQILN